MKKYAAPLILHMILLAGTGLLLLVNKADPVCFRVWLGMGGMFLLVLILAITNNEK